eukprot:10076591-Heterocapsa_arctica.AAC.1
MPRNSVMRSQRRSPSASGALRWKSRPNNVLRCGSLCARAMVLGIIPVLDDAIPGSGPQPAVFPLAGFPG